MSKLVLVLVGVLLLGLAGCGPAATPQPTTPAGPLEVEVTLGAPTEFAVTVPQTQFTVNTPYHFVITNQGAIPHEFMIMPRGAMEHEEGLAEVEEDMLGPGMTATLDFTFTETGEYEFSCLLPGHYEAGMYVYIEVS